MNISFLVEHLRNSLPASSLAFVVSALRQDPILWESLQDPELWNLISARPRPDPEDWSPASLGLLALQDDEAEALQVSALRADAQFPLEPSLRRRAAKAFENISTGQGSLLQGSGEVDCHAPAVLAQSVLLALALRERRRLTGSWNKLGDELIKATAVKSFSPSANPENSINPANENFYITWRTPLACLYGLIPDAFDMLRALLTPGVPNGHRAVVVHILLSNPQPQEKVHNHLRALLSALPLAESILLLDQLYLKRPEMASPLAEELLSLRYDQGLSVQPSLPAQADYPAYIHHLDQLLLLARINQLAVKPVQALPFLNTALEVSTRLQAELAALIAQNAAQRGDEAATLPALKQATQLAPDNPLYRANLALAQQSSAVEGEAAPTQLQSVASDEALFVHIHPALLLAETRISALKGEADNARRSAQAFLDLLQETPDHAEYATAASYLISHHGLVDQTSLPGKDFTRLLLDLELPAGAAACARRVLQIQPDDPELLALLAKAEAAIGQLAEAAGSLEIALCISPDQMELHRQLAGYYERLEDWKSAFKEYTSLLDGSSEEVPNPDDLHHLSACALRVGEAEKAIRACQRALALNAEDGLAHSDLGRALASLGDTPGAEEHLILATQYTPALVEPWLALAHLQKEAGRAQQALETLRAGSQAAVENAELYLELGEAYLADWEGHGHPAPTQALAMFQHAYALATGTIPASELSYTGTLILISFRLGQTLQQLGRADEARHVVEPAYQADPDYPGLAYTYAQVMLALGEPETALPAFKSIIDSGAGDLPIYLDYGRALLSIQAQPNEAVSALRQVLEWEPDHAEATALLAEGLTACGDYNAALESYQAAMETSLVDDPVWCSRLSLGLGKTALFLGQPEIAMASLHEAAQADPSNPQIQRALAEAYEAGSLFANALQSARIALRLDSDNVDTLVWFANKAVQWAGPEAGNQPEGSIGASSTQVRIEAVNALARAIQLDPSRTDLLVRLGKAQLLTGEPQAAAETFRRLVAIDDVSCDDLHQSARCLLEMGDAASAVACLEHALHISAGGAFDASGPGSLAFTLIDAYLAAGNPQAALATVEQVLSISQKDLSMFRYKTRLLLELGHYAEALDCLNTALEIEPHNEFVNDFHYQAALILRALGNLPAALGHLEKVLASPEALPMGSVHPASRVLGAELSYAMLKPDKARALLGAQSSPSASDTRNEVQSEDASNPSTDLDLENSFNTYWLRAELALDLDEELQVAEEAARSAKTLIDQCTQPGIYRPRLLAIQSRILSRHGEASQALLALKQAMSLEEQSPEEASSADPFDKLARLFHSRTHSLAAAALELAQWEAAQYLWRQVTEKAPHEPLAYLFLAATLVSRAEAERFCEDVELVNHTPGQAALAEHARLAFEAAIESASTCQPVDPGNPMIVRWRRRGQAVFTPTLATAQALANLPIFPLGPEDVAAHIANLRSLNENIQLGAINTPETNLPPIVISPATLAAQAARAYPQHPLVLAQLALTLAAKGEYIKDALTAAQAAVKAQADKGLSCPPASWLPVIQEGSPTVVVNAMLAAIAFKAGEIELANQAIQTALAGWFDEPRWQALAASIQNARGDTNLMVAHLEQATTLDPDNLTYFMALGEACLAKAQNQPPEAEGNPLGQAIRAFEKATELAPELPEPWIALAGAHRKAKDLAHAGYCAEQAIRLAPDQAQPLILRAEIALQSGDAQQARERAQAAISLEDQAGDNQAVRFFDNYSNPVLLLARALLSLDRPDEALDVLEKRLPSAQEPLPLLLERVQLLRRARGAQAATDALHDLSQNYPDEPLVLAPLARVMAESGQTDNAIKLAQRSLQAAASQATVRGDYLNLDIPSQVEMHILLGRMFRQTGQLDQALHHLNEAIHLDPHLLEPYLELGRTHQERRQLNQALQIYNEATNIAPKDPRPYFQAGLALKESKDYLGAENMFRRAAALAPNDLSIHRQLGAVVALNLVHNRRRTNVDL
jgi:tetratricopeptide (TPR) repeat protein